VSAVSLHIHTVHGEWSKSNEPYRGPKMQYAVSQSVSSKSIDMDGCNAHDTHLMHTSVERVTGAFENATARRVGLLVLPSRGRQRHWRLAAWDQKNLDGLGPVSTSTVLLLRLVVSGDSACVLASAPGVSQPLRLLLLQTGRWSLLTAMPRCRHGGLAAARAASSPSHPTLCRNTYQVGCACAGAASA